MRAPPYFSDWLLKIYMVYVHLIVVWRPTMSSKKITVTAGNGLFSIADLEDRSVGKKRKAESTRDEPEKHKRTEILVEWVRLPYEVCLFRDDRLSMEEVKSQLYLLCSSPAVTASPDDCMGIMRAVMGQPTLLNAPGEKCYLFALYWYAVYAREDLEERSSLYDQKTILFFEMLDQLPTNGCIDAREFTKTLVELAKCIRYMFGPVDVHALFPFLQRVYDRTPSGDEGRRAIMDAVFWYLFDIEAARQDHAFDHLDHDYPAIGMFQCFMTKIPHDDLSADNAEQLLEWVKFSCEKNGASDMALDPFFCDVEKESWPAFWRHMCDLAGTV